MRKFIARYNAEAMRSKVFHRFTLLAPALLLASASMPMWATEAATWQSGDLSLKATTSVRNNGEHSRLESSVQVQRELDGGRLQLEYAHRQERQDGNQCAMSGGSAGCVFDPFYRNGQNTDRLNVAGEFNLNERLKAATSAQWQKGVADLDDLHVDRREVTRRVIDAKSEFQLSRHVGLEANAKDQWDSGDEFQHRDLKNQWETLQSWRQLQAHWVPSKAGRMSVGWTQSGDSTVRGQERAQDRSVAGWFAGWKLNVSEKLGFDGRIAQKNHSEFGSQDEGQLSLKRKLSDDREVIASARATYKVPSLYELNFPSRGDLGQVPERWESLQTTLRGKSWSVDAAVHHVKPDRDTLPNTMNGIEVGSSLKVGDTTLRANAISFDIATQDGLQLAHRVRHSGRVMVDRDLGKASVGVTVNAFGKRFLDDLNSHAVDGHARVDLRTAFDITPNVRLDAGINNVFNRRADAIGWYDQPGRQLQFNFRINQ